MADKIDLRTEIHKLVTLQEIDSELFDLAAEKGSFLPKIQERDAILEQERAGIKTAEQKLKELQASKKDRDNDLASAEEKIIKHEGELAKIKTNKEYTAMLEQIKSLRADVSMLEEKILSILDEIDTAACVLGTEKGRFETEQKKIDKEKEEIKSEERKVDGRINELRTKRLDLVKSIDASLMKRYDKILQNRGKHAVSKVNGEFCGICNMRLRPQVINEVKMFKDVITCESCSRILYVEQ